jgi:hypothetical protein
MIWLATYGSGYWIGTRIPSTPAHLLRTQPGRLQANTAWCGAARGSTFRGTCAPPSGSGASPPTVTSTWVSGASAHVRQNKTGKVSKVKVLYSQGIANQAGSGSCVCTSNRTGEALTGERAGRVLSREKRRKGMERRRDVSTRKATLRQSIMRDSHRLHEVEDPVHARKHFAQETGRAYVCPLGDGTAGCSGKSKDGSQR